MNFQLQNLIPFFIALGTSFYLSFAVPEPILRSGQARFANSIYISTIASLIVSLLTRTSNYNVGIKWIEDLQIQNSFCMPRIVYILALVGLLSIVCSTIFTHIHKLNSDKTDSNKTESNKTVLYKLKDHGCKNYMATLLSLVVTVISMLALYIGLMAELSPKECQWQAA